MKVWELEEGKIYIAGGSKFRLKEGMLETIHKNNDGVYWYKTGLTYNDVMSLDFIEVVDTNSHWKPKDNCGFCYIKEYDFSVASVNPPISITSGENLFHTDDKKKVECLALETRIKATIINWRRLHDDVELNMNDRNYIMYDLENNETIFDWEREFLTTEFGYFSSKQKAQQFYEYMKDDIDKYFQMRKELKF